MDNVKILLPFFLAAFAVQQITESLNIVLETYFQQYKEKKDFIIMVCKLSFALLFCVWGNLFLLTRLSVEINTSVDIFISTLFLAAGTEAINSILKYLQYSKENKKAESEEEKMSVHSIKKVEVTEFQN